MAKGRVLLKIFGQVQGVSFRYYTKKEASHLKLNGWVKNEIDGTVVVQVEGDKRNLERFIHWCYNGSSFAQVEKINIQWQPYQGNLEQFEVRF